MANGYCGLMDGSEAGYWRLPNIRELYSVIDFGQSRPALPPGHPFFGVQDGYYWSSTTTAHYPGNAFLVRLGYGYGSSMSKAITWSISVALLLNLLAPKNSFQPTGLTTSRGANP